MKKLLRRDRCPKCAEEGRDSAGDNLYVYKDGAFCHAGHGRVRLSDSEVTMRSAQSDATPQECMNNPKGSDPARNLPASVVERYGIRVVYDEVNGTLKRVYYPYTDERGTLTGVKIRVMPKDFYVAGKLQGCFGKGTANHFDRSLFITEGEEDAMALCAILHNQNDVVSVPNGANLEGKLDAAVLADQPFFTKYRKVYICMDTDAPGSATAKRLANWLSGFVPEVAIVILPGKDASECWVQGKEKEVRDAIRDTPVYTPEGIVSGRDLRVQDLLRPRPQGIPTPFKELDAKLKGIRKAELTTVCAGSGIGKSTLVREIGYHLVTNCNRSVCHITLEQPFEDTAASYIAMHMGVPPAVFLNNPGCFDAQQIEAAANATVRKMYFFNHFGSIARDSFLEKLRYYARCGVDFIVLDHLSMIVSGLDTRDERREIDRIMTDLASMVVETGCGIISVVHLKRKDADGQSYNHGGEVSLNDLRGSAALEQLSWSVIAMERNQQAEDGTEDYSTLRVLKNRTWGYTGRAGKVRYDHSTGRLFPVEQELPIPLEQETPNA